MLAKELLRWSDRAKELNEILKETQSLEHKIRRHGDEAAHLLPGLMEGVVRKPINTGVSMTYVLDSSYDGTRKLWITPSCIGYRAYPSARSTTPLRSHQLIRMLKTGAPIINIIEEHTHKDEYVTKIKFFVKCFKRLEDYNESTCTFEIKPYSVVTNSNSSMYRSSFDGPTTEYHIVKVTFGGGRLNLNEETKDEYTRTTNRSAIGIVDFVMIQQGYPQIKMAAKKYRTVLRNIEKHNVKVMDDLKNDLARWLVLEAL